ncbi:DUF6565 domain-containing protein [Pontibacter ruber]|uniref:DUF6565 domain-containing protein n=1 Tax=Pontibacter ruber TaxID=1343895 RepID=A0ABW5CX92_9BACT|nr:DUF6565 domain-containing protein [Pontibacter ruber]
MKKITKWALTLMLAAFALGAQAQSKLKLEQDLADLRAWMRTKANQGDSLTRAEWPHIKSEYTTRTQHQERNSGQLSDKSKQEYSELKSGYRQLEQKNEERYGDPLNRETAARWERTLAGTSNIRGIKSHQMRDAFIRFMDSVRAQRSNWSLRDWDYAEHVYLQLSDRKQQVLDNMTTGDKMKVAALQVEFNTLRTSRDVKERYNESRQQR